MSPHLFGTLLQPCSVTIIFNSGQLWRYNNDKELINYSFESTGSYLAKSWTLPEENTEGYIEASDEVLSVSNLTDPQSPVKLEARIIPISEEQKWYRGTSDENGWFLLTNPHTGKVLWGFYLSFTHRYYTQIDGN